MPEQLTISHEIARRHAETGMQGALERAADGMPQWPELAFDFLRRYARLHRDFAGWMVVRSAATSPNFPAPPTGKAWGAVIKCAARLGWIERVGMTKDPFRHGNPIPLWRSLLHQEVAQT